MAVEVGSAYVSIVPSARGFSSKLRRELGGTNLAGVGRGIGSTLAGGVVASMGGVGRRVSTALATTMRAAGRGAAIAFGAGVTAAGAAVFKGFQTLASLEQSQIAFETLLGSPEDAQAFLTDLTEFAKATPFELPGLVDAARQLIGVEVAADDVLPTLEAFGDTAGALGLNQEQFGRAMLATTQAISKGKFQAEELLQITEAGIPIWPILARAMGTTVPELQKMSKEGKLLAEDVMPALRDQMGEEFGGAMARQSQTITGLLSTLWDTINIGLATAVTPFQDQLKSGLRAAISGVGRAIEAVVPHLETFGKWIGERLVPWVVNDAIPAIGDFGRAVVEWFRDHAIPAFREFVRAISDNWDGISSIFANLGRAASATAGIFGDELDSMSSAAEGETSAIAQFVEGMVSVIEGITDVTADVLEFVERNWPQISKAINLASDLISGDLGGVANAIRTAFYNMAVDVADYMEDVLNAVRNALVQMAAWAAPFGEEFVRIGIDQLVPEVSIPRPRDPNAPTMRPLPPAPSSPDPTFDSGFSDNRTMAGGTTNIYVRPGDEPTAEAIADRLRRQRLAYSY